MSEKCMWCSAEYETVYHVPDEVWKEVSGKEDGSGLICMSCFDDEALHQGKDIWWEAGIGNYPTNNRIKALEGVVEFLKKWLSMTEELDNSLLNVECTFSSEDFVKRDKALLDMKQALKKLEEV